MSQDNETVVRGLIDAASRQDLDQLLELTDPDVEWHSALATLRDGGVYRGHEGIRQYIADLADAFDVWDVGVEDMLTIGQLTILIGRIHFRGKESQVESETITGYVVKIRNGRAILLRAFRDPEITLEGLGRKD